jgi:hypothetical protein
MMSSPRNDPVMLFDCSIIVLRKVEGLTFKSSSPVEDSLRSELQDEDGTSCGSDVQLADLILMLFISIDACCIMKVDGGLVVLQNVTRLLLKFCVDVGDDSAPNGRSAIAKRGLFGRAVVLASERRRFLSTMHESDVVVKATLHCSMGVRCC